MKSKKPFFMISLIVLAIILTGCAVGPRAEGSPGLSADGEHIYLAARSVVYQLNLFGEEQWRYPEKPSAALVMYAAPHAMEESVLVGDLSNKLHALNKADGSVKWSFSGAKGWFLAPANSDEKLIYAPSLDRNVYALDENGNQVWAYNGNFGFLAQPIITDKLIIIASQEHEIFALDKQTGAQVWSEKTAGCMVASPLFDESSKTLFAGGMGKAVVALDADTGKTKWTFDNSGQMGAIWSTPILVENNLIITDDLGVIYSISPDTGMLNWTILTNEPMMAGPVKLDEGFAVVSIAGNVRAYNLNQAPRWTLSLANAQVYTTPVVAGGNIIIANKTTKNENLLFAVDQNGVQKWAFTPSAK